MRRPASRRASHSRINLHHVESQRLRRCQRMNRIATTLSSALVPQAPFWLPAFPRIPAVRVVLIEAGPRDRHPLVHIPIGFSRLVGDHPLNWANRTEPQHAIDGRRIRWPRGRVLGGSSSINGMVWVRGSPKDYDQWAQLSGDRGWSWDQLQYLFERIEAAGEDADPRLGRNGAIPLATTMVANPAVKAFLAAGANRGLRQDYPLAISDVARVGYYLITTRRGRRVSSAVAYLNPARGRQNLHIVTRAPVSGIEIDRDLKATGVTVGRGQNRRRFSAGKGVILAAGAIGTPQLLMLSGIGAPDTLRRHGIEVRVARTEVGLHLRDHFGVRIMSRITPPVSINSDIRRPWRLIRHALHYALTRRGPFSMGGAHAGAFLRTNSAPAPDVQVHFLPVAMRGPGWDFHPFSATTANVCQLRPKSSGSIKLRSAEPAEAPLIDPRYLSDLEDQEVLLAGVRMVRDLLNSQPFCRPMGAIEFAPGPDVTSDDELLAYIRDQGSTVFHPVGTCRMGGDCEAVVDARGRVRGARNLFVADASIMPTIPSGNTNAATAVIAERISEILRARCQPSEAYS